MLIRTRKVTRARLDRLLDEKAMRGPAAGGARSRGTDW
jgi:hypothetical protein